MNEKNLIIKINDIRAVKNAKITLDGITVITGENGCGKSTISKLTYNFFLTAINFDKILDSKYNDYFKETIHIIDTLLLEIYPYPDFKKNSSLHHKIIYDLGINTAYENYKNLIKFIDYFQEMLKISMAMKEKADRSLYLKRQIRLKRILENYIGEDFSDNTDINFLILKLKNIVKDKYEKLIAEKRERPIDVLDVKIKSAFYDNPIPMEFNFYEYGTPLIDRDNGKILNLHSIEKVAYIDTPMIVGLDARAINKRQHWTDINNLIEASYTFDEKNADMKINNIFKDDILNGDVIVQEELGKTSFLYKRKDQNIFDLFECATGLKSFSFLRLLYKNNFLDDKTLLIIDEPEVHLHPQWIVEYARLIVLLNKELGVKFLLASHNPDMISALKHIYKKENKNNDLNFYLAEKEKSKKETYKYNYRHLKTDIEDIFESFNIALERIDQYGEFDE